MYRNKYGEKNHCIEGLAEYVVCLFVCVCIMRGIVFLYSLVKTL